MLQNSMQNQINQFQNSFESIKEYTPEGIEFWRARNLMSLLGYNTEYRHFEPVIQKAMGNFDYIVKDLIYSNGLQKQYEKELDGSCISMSHNSIFSVELHFISTIYTIKNGNGRQQELPDFILTRMACYSIAMEADNRKPEVKLAKQYMLVSILENEKRKQYIQDNSRIERRADLSDKEKSLDSTLTHYGTPPNSIGYVKSHGDDGFFDTPGGTQAVKEELGIPNNRPLYDYAPEDVLTNKAMADFRLKYSIINNDLHGRDIHASEAFKQNQIQREEMHSICGKYPEEMMPVERIGEAKKRKNITQKEAVKKMLSSHIDTNIDPRLYTVFDYGGYEYTLGHWCYINNIDPNYTLSLLDQGIPFEQAIFMRPSGKECPIIILKGDHD